MYKYIIFFCVLLSCTSDNVEDYFGSNDEECDSLNIYYIDDEPIKSIAFIVEDKCLGCHQLDASNGIELNLYGNVVNYLTLDLIDNSLYPFMPPAGSPQLTDCEKEQIENWINNGYKYEEDHF